MVSLWPCISMATDSNLQAINIHHIVYTRTPLQPTQQTLLTQQQLTCECWLCVWGGGQLYTHSLSLMTMCQYWCYHPFIIQIENLRHREVKGRARGHPARKWQSWDSDARRQGPETHCQSIERVQSVFKTHAHIQQMHSILLSLKGRGS